MRHTWLVGLVVLAACGSAQVPDPPTRKSSMPRSDASRAVVRFAPVVRPPSLPVVVALADTSDAEEAGDDDAAEIPDRDSEDIPDEVDRCPDEPEDHEGFEDIDGCPDPQ